MQCVICEAPARLVAAAGDQERLSCAECGEYRITRSARRMMAGQRFDVDVARIWLAGRRCTGQVPLIDGRRCRSWPLPRGPAEAVCHTPPDDPPESGGECWALFVIR